MSGSLHDVMRTRGVTTLLHFTPLENLSHILQEGALIAREQFDRRQEQDVDFRESTRINDHVRYDGRTHINCSIQRPNVRMLEQKKCSGTIYYLLAFRAEDVCDETTQFAVSNAAARDIQQSGIDSGVKGFLNCYADRITYLRHDGSFSIEVRSPELPTRYPTSIQAEVLIPDRISLQYLTTIYAECEADKRRLEAVLRCQAISCNVPILVSAKAFTEGV